MPLILKWCTLVSYLSYKTYSNDSIILLSSLLVLSRRITKELDLLHASVYLSTYTMKTNSIFYIQNLHFISFSIFLISFQLFDCRNHIRVIQSMDNGNRLYICGTNAHNPKDYVIYVSPILCSFIVLPQFSFHFPILYWNNRICPLSFLAFNLKKSLVSSSLCVLNSSPQIEVSLCVCLFFIYL